MLLYLLCVYEHDIYNLLHLDRNNSISMSNIIVSNITSIQFVFTKTIT
jgi:hypothetical protein